MPAADRRTPAEPLAENDELARLLLLEVTAVQGPAILRAFPAVVEAAARVWSTLPRTSDSGSPGLIFGFGWSRSPVASTAPRLPGCGRATGRPMSGC
jgi:hypothetical protein